MKFMYFLAVITATYVVAKEMPENYRPEWE